jgi:hypothetical protein
MHTIITIVCYFDYDVGVIKNMQAFFILHVIEGIVMETFKLITLVVTYKTSCLVMYVAFRSITKV